MRTMEGFKSLMLFVDSTFNKGKMFNQLMPASYEKAIEQQKEQEKEQDTFVNGQWWLSQESSS